MVTYYLSPYCVCFLLTVVFYFDSAWQLFRHCLKLPLTFKTVLILPKIVQEVSQCTVPSKSIGNMPFPTIFCALFENKANNNIITIT